MRGLFIRLDEYGDWWLTWFSWVCIVVIIIAGIVLIVKMFQKFDDEQFEERCKQVKLLGYSDINDIVVFCNRIGADLEDFALSKGLRKQYELFSEGKTSDFIAKAESVKKAKDSEDSGLATGMAIGLATGMSTRVGK